MKLHELPNPYEGFDATQYPLDLQGWGSDAPIFDDLVRETQSHLIIEVGSWKGASAIHMAQACKREGLAAKIICVDTWLGALEFWDNPNDKDRFLSLNLKNGYPTVYYQFLANVVHAGMEDIIIPLPLPSLIAARWFRKNNILADLIYIDGSHDYDDVSLDIRAYRPLLHNGGVMFGDDYDTFEGVRSAVVDANIPVTVIGNRYWRHTNDRYGWVSNQYP